MLCKNRLNLYFRSETPQNLPKCVDQELPEVPQDQPSASKFFYGGKEIKIEVLYLDNPALWWIRVVDDQQSAELLKLQEAMNGYYSKLKEKKDYRFVFQYELLFKRYF